MMTMLFWAIIFSITAKFQQKIYRFFFLVIVTILVSIGSLYSIFLAEVFEYKLLVSHMQFCHLL